MPSRFLVDVFREFGIDASIVPNLVDLERFRFRERRPLRPHLLSTELVGSMLSVIERFRDRVITEHIVPQDRWRPAT